MSHDLDAARLQSAAISGGEVECLIPLRVMFRLE